MSAQPEKPDVSSLLTHVSTLEHERALLRQEKEKLENMLQNQTQQLDKYQEAKRTEMKTKLDTMITDWLTDIDVADDKIKKEFMNGMERLVKETKDESGVWQVMCCASAAHNRRVSEIQRLQDEYGSIKSLAEKGTFQTEEARVVGKRKEPEQPVRDVWSEFESFMKTNPVNDFIPQAGSST